MSETVILLPKTSAAAYDRLQTSVIMKYHSKVLVSNICHIEFIVYIRKFTIVNILGGIPYQEI